MKRVYSLWVLLASLLTGCGGDGPTPPPPPPPLTNQATIGIQEFELTHGEEVWHGIFYSPCDEADIFLHNTDSTGVAIHFPASLNKVAQGTYPIGQDETAPLEGGCRAAHSLLGEERELLSGRVDVVVSTIDYTITLEGIDDQGNDIYISYVGPLEYRSEGYTGSSTLRMDGGAMGDLGILTLRHYGTTTRGVGATGMKIAVRPQNDLDEVISGYLAFFHQAEMLTAGTYAFSAAGAGTFRGRFVDSQGSYTISNGSIEVVESGDGYTLIFDALTLLDTQQQPHVLTGSFTGPANVEDHTDAASRRRS